MLLLSLCLLTFGVASYPVEEVRTYAISETERVQMTEAEALLRSAEDPDFNFIDVTDGSWDELERNAPASFASPIYPTVMANSIQVNSMILSIDRAYVQKFLEGFTSFKNRYYRSSFGAQSAEYLYQELENIKASSDRTDVKVTITKFAHSWSQFSLVARIENAVNSTDDTVVLGAHQDSINRIDAMNGAAPGVDDDATGVVTNLVVLKALLAARNFVPIRPVELHFYAGEEGGLKGSQEIASKYQATKRIVYGMLQTDMTGYKESKVMGIMTDFVNPELTAALKLVASTYTSMIIEMSSCGYGCSDHASWTRAGYPASLHFESTMKGGNPKIHTPSDTFDFISVDRVIEFMKIAIGFATELSLFQQSSVPTVPTPTPGKPVVPKLIFASQGEPQAIGSLLSKAPVLISYDMARMTKACEELTICWKVGMFGSKSCNTVKAIQSSEISIVVNSSGTVNFSFESFGANGSCAKDSGYQFKFL